MLSTVGIGITIGVWLPLAVNSRVAQWKRAGPITQRSVDRNYALLIIFVFQLTRWDQLYFIPGCQFISAAVPLAQRIARWTSNPKVLGSIPRWDELFSPIQHSYSQLSGESLSIKSVWQRWDSNPRLRGDWCLKPAP